MKSPAAGSRKRWAAITVLGLGVALLVLVTSLTTSSAQQGQICRLTVVLNSVKVINNTDPQPAGGRNPEELVIFSDIAKVVNGQKTHRTRTTVTEGSLTKDHEEQIGRTVLNATQPKSPEGTRETIEFELRVDELDRPRRVIGGFTQEDGTNDGPGVAKHETIKLIKCPPGDQIVERFFIAIPANRNAAGSGDQNGEVRLTYTIDKTDP
jgi:hypothetical protein